MPPLHKNNKARWALVTDQRPLTWNAPERNTAAKSSTGFSVSRVSQRGVFAAGSSSMTVTIDGTVIKLKTVAATLVDSVSQAGAQSEWDGTGTGPSFLDYFGYAAGNVANGAATTRSLYLTISGCAANSGYNGEYQVDTLTATYFRKVQGVKYSWNGPFVGAATQGTGAMGSIGNVASLCVGNTVTFAARQGSLSDSKAVAIGDRVRIKRSTGDYEYRTVDKLWGTGLDITTFSVIDAFDASSSTLNRVPLEMWVDESGSTEDIECSRRGLCDSETGMCACFAGYTGNTCGVQNAMSA